MKWAKLSLPVVEVTILLSNIHSFENKKVISIKKLSDIQQEIKSEPENNENRKQSLKLEIDQLEQKIAQLHEQKKKILEDLKTTIEKERNNWKKEKEEERKEAQRVGYKVGYDAGYEEVFEKHQEQLNEANRIVSLAKKDYDKTLNNQEQAILQLAITAAERIMNNQLEETPELFHKIVKQAIKELQDSSNVEIYVHRHNYEHLYEHKEELEEVLRDEDILSIYIDDSLAETDCIIKHPYGQIDAGIDTQLKQIKQALEEKLTEY